MRTSQEGIELIKYFEGCSLVPYKDIAGYWTIGIGHLMKEYQDISLTEQESEDILAHDLLKSENSIRRLVKVPLNQNQFDALVSFTFNLGSGALQRSQLRAKINREEYIDAAPEFLKWCRAGGRISRGLIKRRKAEMKLFSS